MIRGGWAALALLAGCAPKVDPCGVALRPSVSTLAVNPFLDVAGGRALGATPVEVTGLEGLRAKDAARTVTLAAVGATLLDADGAPLARSTTLAELPSRMLVDAGSAGPASLGLTVDTCPASTTPLAVVAHLPVAGRTTERGFLYRDAFAAGQAIEVADPVAEGGTAWVVAHRALADWAADPALVDVSGGAEAVDAGVVAWSAPDVPAGALGARFDVVVDRDGDGALSPGDALDQGIPAAGEVAAGVAVLADFGAAGPHATAQVDVSGGDWLGERVYYPEDIADLGPRPLVVIAHGNGHDYTWYDYLGEHLSSWGYVVMAHQNETQPGIETASTTTLTNTDWFLSHLDAVDDGALVGRVDGHRIVWIGHSRGGEGVVRAYTRLTEGDYVPEAFGVDDVRMLVSIAPTVFNDVSVSNPYGVRYHLIAGSSDGDVTGAPDVAATQYWRLLQADTGVTSSTYLYGVSHEDFNCCGYQDGMGPDQLTRTQAQDIARAYILAMAEDGVSSLADGGDPYARLALENDPLLLPATAFDSVALSTFKPVGAQVVDDFQSEPDPGVASSGASVAFTVADVDEGLLMDGDGALTWTDDDPMNGMTQAAGPGDLAAGVVFDWEQPAAFGYTLAGAQDWSGARALTLRVCQGTRHPLTVALDGDLAFSVTVTDGAGVSVTRPAITPAAAPYQRNRAGNGTGWSNAFSTVRLPLVDFTTADPALDLTDIVGVRLEFGGEGDAPFGRLGLDDLEIER